MKKIKIILVVLFIICVILYFKNEPEEEIEIITHEKVNDSNIIFNEECYDSDGRFDKEM